MRPYEIVRDNLMFIEGTPELCLVSRDGKVRLLRDGKESEGSSHEMIRMYERALGLRKEVCSKCRLSVVDDNDGVWVDRMLEVECPDGGLHEV